MAIMNVTKNVKNQFSNDKNLAMRINFYKKYTTNKYKFADWLFDKYVFKKNMKIRMWKWKSLGRKNWNFARWL